jgi:hypothetical protein
MMTYTSPMTKRWIIFRIYCNIQLIIAEGYGVSCLVCFDSSSRMGQTFERGDFLDRRICGALGRVGLWSAVVLSALEVDEVAKGLLVTERARKPKSIDPSSMCSH